MNSARWQRVSTIVARALEVPPGGRAAVVEQEAAGDEELRREVESLLAAEVDSGDFLEPPSPGDLGRMAESADAEGLAGRRAGPYAIERPIGSGGMGQVFLARRADGAFEQTVALKLVKRGMDTDRILERFRGERQVLAQLEHPGIARLVDGGATEDGRPYLAMEYVDGEPIDRWCAERELGTRARVELFLHVCEAVQHAHQRLVVHRDLKPANVLVDAEGRPKLLDFGLAKVLSPDGRERTYDVTAEGERLMTPHYASPEQVRGEPVTTATDVYALGVLLHELLGGRRPYDLDGRTWTEVERLICQEDPPRLGLEADLDTIVAVALCKEPEGRYASVEALAEDLRRWLGGLPIEARPTTVVYRARKFVRRNRLLVGSLAAIFVVLVGAVIGVGRQARIARDKAQVAEDALVEARESLDDTRAVSDFLTRVFLAAAPRVLGKDATVLQAVDVAAAEAEGRLATRPWVEGTVRSALGTSYRTLGSLDKARAQLERAVEIQVRELGEKDPVTASTLYELALVYRDRGDHEAAERTCDRLPAGWKRAQVLELRGHCAYETGDTERAEEFYREAVALREEEQGPAHPETLVARKYVARVLSGRGAYAEAEELLREVLAGQTEQLGPSHVDTLITRVDLATVLRNLRRMDEAEVHYREAFEGFDAQLPPGHLDRLSTGMQLGYLLALTGRHEQVAERVAPLLAAAEEALGPDHVVTDSLRIDLGAAYAALGRYELAAQVERRSVDSALRVHGPGAPRTVEAQRNLERARLALR